MFVGKKDVQDVEGTLQGCAVQDAGAEAGI